MVGQTAYTPPKISEKYTKDLEAAIMLASAGKTDQAITEIDELIKKFPTWTEPRQHLGRILYESGKKNVAIKILEDAIAIDTNSQLQQLYTLGRLYQEAGEYDKALHAYNTVIRKAIHQQGLVQRATAGVQDLESKRQLIDSTYSITLLPLTEGINTIEHEALGRWTVTGREVIFTRYANDQEDLFQARLDEDDRLIGVEDFSFNTNLNEGGHTISPDGKYMIFTSCSRTDGMGSCDLYLVIWEENAWSKPVNMGPGFNSVSWDSQPCFGLDGLSLYFSSTRPGGFGGSDIWMVKEISRGNWSKPINLGPDINTTNNESSPFIHFDGRTMYFMRDGKEGLGGYDLYFSRQELNGQWKSALNMGSPINSGNDEGALSLHPDGRRAMITRYSDERKNDLYEFELPQQFQSTPIQVLHVHVTESGTSKPVLARLEVFDINKKDTIRTSQWADADGNITVTIDRNTSYGIIASAEGYIMHSSNLPADTSASRHLDITMIPLRSAVDKAIVLQNIFFETGSAKLLPSSNPELNKLLWTLRNNKNMKIEIRGHTDNVGEVDYNQQLSEDRAKAVYQYLFDRGIETTRISFKGFGETQPVATNETEAGRQNNRRTEFVITSQ